MQDLLTVVPFAAVGLAMIVVALVFARQTTVSGRKVDRLMAETGSRGATGWASASDVGLNPPTADSVATERHEERAH